MTLARDASVTVVSLVEDHLFEQLGRSMFPKGKELTNMLLEQLQADIDLIISDDSWQGIKISGEILQGNGFISVIQKVLRDKHDLIIKRGSAV